MEVYLFLLQYRSGKMLTDYYAKKDDPNLYLKGSGHSLLITELHFS
jgi:hypothetical protein